MFFLDITTDTLSTYSVIDNGTKTQKGTIIDNEDGTHTAEHVNGAWNVFTSHGEAVWFLNDTEMLASA